MRDLVAQKVLLIDEDGKLISKENLKRDGKTKDIFCPEKRSPSNW
jgi:hypothetical protein